MGKPSQPNEAAFFWCIYLLQLSYVIYPVHSFSPNLRNEIKTTQKIYFYDTVSEMP